MTNQETWAQQCGECSHEWTGEAETEVCPNPECVKLVVGTPAECKECGDDMIRPKGKEALCATCGPIVRKRRGKTSKRKGNSGENEVKKAIWAIFPEMIHDVTRGFQSINDIAGFFSHWFEVRKGKQRNMRKALRDAKGKCPPGWIPIAVVIDDAAPGQRRKPPTVLVELEDYLQLQRELYDAKAELLALKHPKAVKALGRALEEPATRSKL